MAMILALITVATYRLYRFELDCCRHCCGSIFTAKDLLKSGLHRAIRPAIERWVARKSRVTLSDSCCLPHVTYFFCFLWFYYASCVLPHSMIVVFTRMTSRYRDWKSSIWQKSPEMLHTRLSAQRNDYTTEKEKSVLRWWKPLQQIN